MIELRTDTSTLQEQLEVYDAEWQELIERLALQALSSEIKASSVGWKVDGVEAFGNILGQLLMEFPQVHVGPVNDVRLIGSIILPSYIYREARVLKLMQRRPGSTDPLGLDHVDFTVRDLAATQTILTASGVQVTPEQNDSHSWLSVRFGNENRQEAKFVDHNVIEVCIQELKETRDKLV